MWISVTKIAVYQSRQNTFNLNSTLVLQLYKLVEIVKLLNSKIWCKNLGEIRVIVFIFTLAQQEVDLSKNVMIFNPYVL